MLIMCEKYVEIPYIYIYIKWTIVKYYILSTFNINIINVCVVYEKA